MSGAALELVVHGFRALVSFLHDAHAFYKEHQDQVALLKEFGIAVHEARTTYLANRDACEALAATIVSMETSIAIILSSSPNEQVQRDIETLKAQLISARDLIKSNAQPENLSWARGVAWFAKKVAKSKEDKAALAAQAEKIEHTARSLSFVMQVQVFKERTPADSDHELKNFLSVQANMSAERVEEGLSDLRVAILRESKAQTEELLSAIDASQQRLEKRMLAQMELLLRQRESNTANGSIGSSSVPPEQSVSHINRLISSLQAENDALKLSRNALQNELQSLHTQLQSVKQRENHIIPNLRELKKEVDFKLLPGALGLGAYGKVQEGVWTRVRDGREIEIAFKAIDIIIPATTGKMTRAERERVVQDLYSKCQDALRHEATMIQRLRHPNIIRLFAFSSDPLGLVFELCNAGNLREWLWQPRSNDSSSTSSTAFLSCETVRDNFNPLDCGRQLLAAVTAMHHAGIVHGDIKSENVMCHEHPNTNQILYKIGDFGSACLARNDTLSTRTIRNDASSSSSSTGGGGTMRWLSRERLDGSSVRLTHADDVYSLGLLLGELFSQLPPYAYVTHQDRDQEHELLRKAILAGKPAFLPEAFPRSVRTEMCDLVEACQLTSLQRPTMQALTEHFWMKVAAKVTPLSPIAELKQLCGQLTAAMDRVRALLPGLQTKRTMSNEVSRMFFLIGTQVKAVLLNDSASDTTELANALPDSGLQQLLQSGSTLIQELTECQTKPSLFVRMLRQERAGLVKLLAELPRSAVQFLAWLVFLKVSDHLVRQSAECWRSMFVSEITRCLITNLFERAIKPPQVIHCTGKVRMGSSKSTQSISVGTLFLQIDSQPPILAPVHITRKAVGDCTLQITSADGSCSTVELRECGDDICNALRACIRAWWSMAQLIPVLQTVLFTEIPDRPIDSLPNEPCNTDHSHRGYNLLEDGSPEVGYLLHCLAKRHHQPFQVDNSIIAGDITLNSIALDSMLGADADIVAFDNRLWQTLHAYKKERCFVGGGTLMSSVSSTDTQSAVDGILLGCTYIILQLLQVDDIRLIKLRYPRGEGEWKGDWGEDSDKWTQKMRALCRYEETVENGGTFWMSLEDFSTHFERVYICTVFDHVVELTLDGMPVNKAALNTKLAAGQLVWYKASLNGEWRGVTAAGHVSHLKQFPDRKPENNPHFLLRLKDNQSGIVFLTLIQDAGTDSDAYHFISMLVIANDGKRGRNIKKSQLIDGNPKCRKTREICAEVNVEANKEYTIYVSTYEPNQEASFIVQAYCRDPIVLIPLDSNAPVS